MQQWLVNTDSKTKSWVEAVSIYTLMWLYSLKSMFFFLYRLLLKIRQVKRVFPFLFLFKLFLHV